MRYLSCILAILMSLCVAACGFQSGAKYVPSDYVSQPIVSSEDGIALAEQVAHRWDSSAYLVSITGVYRPEEKGFELIQSYYNFVSGDAMKYIGVTIRSSGDIQVDLPAKVEGSFVTTEPYAVDPGDISEPQALELAWVRLGSALMDTCGPVESISIERTNLFSGKPIWSLTYFGHEALLGDITLDTVTGEATYENINENFCK